MTKKTSLPTALAAISLAALCACELGGGAADSKGITASTHKYFPVDTGDHAFDCATCHSDPSTFGVVTCTDCHTHAKDVTDRLHLIRTEYKFETASCLVCHTPPVKLGFSHFGITSGCAACHDVAAAFARLPKDGFTHIPTRGEDCATCHNTTEWAHAGAPGVLVNDPARAVAVTGLVPAYVGTTLSTLSAHSQKLPMSMDHQSPALSATVLAGCNACHAQLVNGNAFPGVLHASLTAAGAAQPTTCASCHADAMPVGFVGPTATNPARSPASGEMKHDAVAWANGKPGTTPLVTADCGACHVAPGAAAATWATPKAGNGPAALYHASVAAQPASCLDCHANSRPTAAITTAVTSPPGQRTFDHANGATGECSACHAGTGAGVTSWKGGKFHTATSGTPSTCLPCHEGQRPTSTTGWLSTTFQTSPFDYGTNPAGVKHGNGMDCVTCHANAGTGAWGTNHNWAKGAFDHAANKPSTCMACHMSQRLDLQAGHTPAEWAALVTPNFDHATAGKGDCIGCHAQTVTRGSYVSYQLPGGDWRDGSGYPGATIVSDPNSKVTVTELLLTRTGSFVTGYTTTSLALYGGMAHVSAAIPAAMSPGPAAAPDYGKCWHCHAPYDATGAVQDYTTGVFHTALAAYKPTLGGAVSPLPQPTAHCSDCHAPMWPGGIVELTGTNHLVSMDHSATFKAATVINGVTASKVDDLDCSNCHHKPGPAAVGGAWNDGAFHKNIGAAVPADCVLCHYPLMASTAADVASGTTFTMAHRATVLTQQACEVCHTTALAQSTVAATAAQWKTGALHPKVAAQPTACLACHTGSAPAATTQGTVAYTFPQGANGTSNTLQWMSHQATGVKGAECAPCHQADAKASGAAWSKASVYHVAGRTSAACSTCHGTSNGNGAVQGTGNNLPAGVTDSLTKTTASAASGVASTVLARIDHANSNVTTHECSFCHTQAGTSTAAGIQGKEWAQARFHASFTTTAPYVKNATTGRCSACHLNERPGATFAGQDHSTFTNASTTKDCGECHDWPGTGSASAPNWLGAGAPALLTVGGFNVPAPPAPTTYVQAGLANLAHPDTAANPCSACHTGGIGGKGAIGYDHNSPAGVGTLITLQCNTCHEYGSNLISTAWNKATTTANGAGDSRPYTLTSVTASYKGNTKTYTVDRHFMVDRAGVKLAVDCGNCHDAPVGLVTTTTGTTYKTRWAFKHPPENPKPSYCTLCHNPIPN
ncbi:MAG: hypothetical protein U0229_18900 [Anaeromyxobacter sp.]